MKYIISEILVSLKKPLENFRFQFLLSQLFLYRLEITIEGLASHFLFANARLSQQISLAANLPCIISQTN